MSLRFINREDMSYEKAVAIRIDAFFKKMPNAKELINDADESKSLHIIFCNENEVLGTGRLTITSDIAIISQMAIHNKYRGKGIGSQILKALIDKSIQLEVKVITLSARQTAIPFYLKYQFEAFGEFYPSKKTGIIHRKMKLVL